MIRLFRRLYDAYKGRVPVGKPGTLLRVGDGVYVVSAVHVQRTMYGEHSVQIDAVSLTQWYAMRKVLP